MWAVLSSVSAGRRRKLRAKWRRADEATIRERHRELALDADSLGILDRWARTLRDADLTRRILTVVDWADGWPPGFIAEAFRSAPSTVHRTLNRYRDEGPAGLVDRRKDNGHRKVDEDHLKTLTRLVYGRPTDLGERRPTWTQELLVRVAAKKTGIAISTQTMSRALAAIQARLGRPRPSVGCPGRSEDGTAASPRSGGPSGTFRPTRSPSGFLTPPCISV